MNVASLSLICTSSCVANTYHYATPTTYAINSTTGSPPAPTCATGKTYVTKADDSCNTIAEAQGVSTEALISLNGIDLDCKVMPAAGTSLCLPPPCATYQVQPSDNCTSIAAAANITLGQLLAWNPVISPRCGSLVPWAGRFICVSSPLGTVVVPGGNVVTTAVPVPTNTQGGSTTYCGQWYTIRQDDSCASISLAFSITLDDFYFLNAGVDKKTCNNLWLGYSYCVKAVGDIETYPGHTVSVPSTSFTRPPVQTETPPPVFYPPPDNAHAPGTIDGCDLWANAVDITLTQLRRWNPSLKEDNCVLLAQYSYCLIKKDDMNDPLTIATRTSTAPTTTTTSSTPTGSPPPAETQTGASKDCKAWHVVKTGDGCYDIAHPYSISLDDFYKWNPGVGSNCEHLWLGYAGEDVKGDKIIPVTGQIFTNNATET
ncbi:LysM domain-containing protein [Cladobotryum mycophilum]|uniref:LysM domain-containing protein n=1 Tax=Cladobotryum mycophilum TaxID=491253 RepID=A0ABR0SWY5_9HYPO